MKTIEIDDKTYDLILQMITSITSINIKETIKYIVSRSVIREYVGGREYSQPPRDRDREAIAGEAGELRKKYENRKGEAK